MRHPASQPAIQWVEGSRSLWSDASHLLSLPTNLKPLHIALCGMFLSWEQTTREAVHLRSLFLSTGHRRRWNVKISIPLLLSSQLNRLVDAKVSDMKTWYLLFFFCVHTNRRIPSKRAKRGTNNKRTWSESTQLRLFQFYYGSFCECKIGGSCLWVWDSHSRSESSSVRRPVTCQIEIVCSGCLSGLLEGTTLWQFIVCVFLIKRMDKLVRVCNLLFINEVQVPNGFVLVCFGGSFVLVGRALIFHRGIKFIGVESLTGNFTINSTRRWHWK